MHVECPVYVSVAVRCSVLQCVAVCEVQFIMHIECLIRICSGILQGVAGCCRVLQCVAVCCSVMQCVAVCCSVLQSVAECCSVL